MAYRDLELTLLSGWELKNVNLITRMDVYAVVTMSGDPMTRQCTAPDPYGGRNPCWDATFRFAVAPTAAAAAGRCLHVLLRAERVLGDRDVGEVVIPLAEVLGGAATAGPQPTQQASYQVRKVHRREPRGVLYVSYRLGPVVAPVEEKPPAPVMAYPVGVPSSKPSRPTADDAYPVGVPAKPSHPKVDAYQRPPPPPPPLPPRYAAEHEEAPAAAPAPASGKGKTSNDGFGPEIPPLVCLGPYTQIIFGGPTGGQGPAAAATTTMAPPAGSNVSSPRKADGGAWLKHDTQGGAYYGPAQQPIRSPRMEAFQAAEATSPRAPSRSSSSSSSSSNYPFAPSPASSAHSFAPSPFSSGHHSTPSPRHHLRQLPVSDSQRSAASTPQPAISSPLAVASSPLVANHHHSAMVPSR